MENLKNMTPNQILTLTPMQQDAMQDMTYGQYYMLHPDQQQSLKKVMKFTNDPDYYY
jgi:hypothetical protein